MQGPHAVKVVQEEMLWIGQLERSIVELEELADLFRRGDHAGARPAPGPHPSRAGATLKTKASARYAVAFHKGGAPRFQHRATAGGPARLGAAPAARRRRERPRGHRGERPRRSPHRPRRSCRRRPCSRARARHARTTSTRPCCSRSAPVCRRWPRSVDNERAGLALGAQGTGTRWTPGHCNDAMSTTSAPDRCGASERRTSSVPMSAVCVSEPPSPISSMAGWMIARSASACSARSSPTRSPSSSQSLAEIDVEALAAGSKALRSEAWAAFRGGVGLAEASVMLIRNMTAADVIDAGTEVCPPTTTTGST